MRTDVLEPLAILDSNYPPTLELTDIFDDSEALTAVPLDDVFPSSNAASIGATAALYNTTTTTTSAATSNAPLATTTLALTDPKT